MNEWTHRHTAISLCLPVGEVAHSPGQVVGGHAWCAREAVRDPAILIEGQAALHRHVGQRGVLCIMPQAEQESGLVDWLIEAGEGLPGMDWTELCDGQVAGRRTDQLLDTKEGWMTSCSNRNTGT